MKHPNRCRAGLHITKKTLLMKYLLAVTFDIFSVYFPLLFFIFIQIASNNLCMFVNFLNTASSPAVVW